MNEKELLKEIYEKSLIYQSQSEEGLSMEAPYFDHGIIQGWKEISANILEIFKKHNYKPENENET